MTDMANESNIYTNLIRLMMRSKKHMADIMESWQLTPMQGMVLTLFDPAKTKTMNELSVIMGCDASNVTGLVDRLEVQGLVERVSSEGDKRIKLIRLSLKGEDCRRKMLRLMGQAEAADLRKLDAREKRMLELIINKLLKD